MQDTNGPLKETFDARKPAEPSRPPKLLPPKQGLSLARLVSVSGISVGVIAGLAMWAEHEFSETSTTTFQVAEDGTATPYVEPDPEAAGQLERRIILLERQIVLLQAENRGARDAETSLLQRIGDLEVRLAAAEARLDEKQVNDRIARDDQGDRIAEGADEIITGSIPDQAVEGDDISDYVAPDVREGEGRIITQTSFALEFELYDSIAELREAWAELERRFGDELTGLQPRALHQGDEFGIVRYRLVVGPIDNAADAASLCARLQSRGLECGQTVYGGELVDDAPSPVTLLRFDVIAGEDGQDAPPSLSDLLEDPPLPVAKPDRRQTGFAARGQEGDPVPADDESRHGGISAEPEPVDRHSTL